LTDAFDKSSSGPLSLSAFAWSAFALAAVFFTAGFFAGFFTGFFAGFFAGAFAI